MFTKETIRQVGKSIWRFYLLETILLAR